MSVWHVGDVWEPEAIIKNKAGVQVDPTTSVTFTIKQPSGKLTVLTGSKVGTVVGQWATTPVELTEAGPWTVSVTTKGTYQASQPATIQVLGVYG